MIDLSEISYLKNNDYYYQLLKDLSIINSYFYEFTWLPDYDYTGTLRIDSTNTTLDIRFYWDNLGSIICTVNDFEVEAYCTMEETCEKLIEYLVNQWLVKE